MNEPRTPPEPAQQLQHRTAVNELIAHRDQGGSTVSVANLSD